MIDRQRPTLVAAPNSVGEANKNISGADKNVLIVLAHPAPHVSRANRLFAAAAQNLPFVKVHELYNEYPGMFIDVRREQALLLAHDIVVLQHPFYWYSVPALLKEWIDLVLEHGWAYGPSGEQLIGKIWSHAISTGGSDTTYASQGANRYPIDDFIRPLEQTALLCGMSWQRPFVSHAARTLDDASLSAEAQRYCDWLSELRNSR